MAALGAWLAFCFAVGLPRALERHFHVDEVQVAYEIALSSVHRRPDLSNGTGPFLVLAGWFVRSFETTAAILAGLRIVFYVVFALTLVAIAWAQPYWTSTRGRIAVLFLTTLFHPLWLYGFEIRLDVLVSAGTVVLFGLLQRAAERDGPLDWRAYAAAGAVSATMQLSSGKAIAYWVPFGGLLVAAGIFRAAKGARLRAPLAFTGGLAAGALANIGLVVLAGRGELYSRVLGSFSGLVQAAARFSPTPELLRTAASAPLYFALAAAQIVLTLVDLARRRGAARSVVTSGALVLVVLLLYANPTPFPYNFQHLMPFVFFASLDVASKIVAFHARIGPRLALGLALVSLGLFVRAWLRDPFLTRTSAAQLSYARAAEALTSPRDTVLDGAGLVATRLPPDRDWIIHSLRLGRYRAGEIKHYDQIMVESPSPVVVDNYRWAWLTPDDLRTRAARYVRIAPRLYVLGSAFAEPDGEFQIYLDGKYKVLATAGDELLVDGARVENGRVLELARGSHRFQRTGQGRAGLHWAGPDEAAASEAVRAIKSLGRGEPMFTNMPTEVPR